MGGFNGARNVNTRQIFDPQTQTFTDVTNCTSNGLTVRCPRRLYQTATRLKDDKVLIVGGYIDGAHLGNSLELFDEATNKFSILNVVLPEALGFHRSTLAPDGSVTIIGGYTGTQHVSDQVYSYVPMSGAEGGVATLAPLIKGRASYAVDTPFPLLLDGSIFVFGGFDVAGKVASPELYHLDSTSEALTCGGCAAREGFGMALMQSSKVLIVGGDDSTYSTSKTAEFFDSKTRTFTSNLSMQVSRYEPMTSVLSDGKVLIIGGFGDDGEPQTSTELFQ